MKKHNRNFTVMYKTIDTKNSYTLLLYNYIAIIVMSVWVSLSKQTERYV